MILLARVLAWVGAVVAAVPLFGLVDLSTMFGLADPAYVWAVPLEVSWGALLTFVVAVSLAWIGTTPQSSWAPFALLAVTVVALVASAFGFADVGPVRLAVGIAVVTGACFLLVRTGLPPRAGHPWSAPLLQFGVGVAGLALWSAYAVLTAVQAGTVAGLGADYTLGIRHWPVQSALGLTMAAGAVLFAGWAPTPRSWRVSAGLTGLAVGAATVAYPDRAGAMPHPAWGIALIVWAAAVAFTPSRRH